MNLKLSKGAGLEMPMVKNLELSTGTGLEMPVVKNLELSTDAGLEMPMANNTSIKQPLGMGIFEQPRQENELLYSVLVENQLNSWWDI